MPSVDSAMCVLRVQELFLEADEITAQIGFKFNNMVTVTSDDVAAYNAHVSEWKTALADLKSDLVRVTRPIAD